MRLVPAHPARTGTSGHNPETDGLGLRGTAPLVTDLSLEDLERDARHAIGEMAYAYYSGGADDERLLEGNVAAWGHWQLHPHVLAGIAEVSTGHHAARERRSRSPVGDRARRRSRDWPIPRARWPPPGALPRPAR